MCQPFTRLVPADSSRVFILWTCASRRRLRAPRWRFASRGSPENVFWPFRGRFDVRVRVGRRLCDSRRLTEIEYRPCQPFYEDRFSVLRQLPFHGRTYFGFAPAVRLVRWDRPPALRQPAVVNPPDDPCDKVALLRGDLFNFARAVGFRCRDAPVFILERIDGITWSARVINGAIKKNLKRGSRLGRAPNAAVGRLPFEKVVFSPGDLFKFAHAVGFRCRDVPVLPHPKYSSRVFILWTCASRRRLRAPRWRFASRVHPRTFFGRFAADSTTFGSGSDGGFATAAGSRRSNIGLASRFTRTVFRFCASFRFTEERILVLRQQYGSSVGIGRRPCASRLS